MKSWWRNLPAWPVREMGFGAGMGLPNMKKNVDELTIESKVGEGTVVRMLTYFSANDR